MDQNGLNMIYVQLTLIKRIDFFEVWGLAVFPKTSNPEDIWLWISAKYSVFMADWGSVLFSTMKNNVVLTVFFLSIMACLVWVQMIIAQNWYIHVIIKYM